MGQLRAPWPWPQAAGLHASRRRRLADLTYNHADPWLPDLLICRPEFTADALAAIHEYLDTH